MAPPYSMWLRGSDTYFAVSAFDLYVPTGTESAPATISTPATPAWLHLQDLPAGEGNMDMELDNGSSIVTTISRNEYMIAKPHWQYKLRVIYNFPSDFTKYTSLLQHLSKKYLYLAMDSYDVAIHAPNSCIAVTPEFTVEHNHSNGTKVVVVTLRQRVESSVV